MDQQSVQANYSNWTLLEIYGHTTEAGFVVAEYFGPTCMFRVDVPEVPAQRDTLKRPQWNEDGTKLLPIGTVIEKSAIPGRTRYLGVGAIFSMSPATEEVVRAAVAQSMRRNIKVISMPPEDASRLLPGEVGAVDEESEDDNDYEISED